MLRRDPAAHLLQTRWQCHKFKDFKSIFELEKERGSSSETACLTRTEKAKAARDKWIRLLKYKSAAAKFKRIIEP